MITESYHAGEGRIFDAERTIRMYRSELAQKQREGNDRNRKRDKYGRSKTVNRKEQFAYRYCDYLVKRQIRADYAMHSLYDQLLRSATSVGANIAEAKFAQSNADYKSKMNIALKEASESRYWIQHLTTAGCIDNGLSNLLLELLNNIINILSSIVNK